MRLLVYNMCAASQWGLEALLKTAYVIKNEMICHLWELVKSLREGCVIKNQMTMDKRKDNKPELCPVTLGVRDFSKSLQQCNHGDHP